MHKENQNIDNSEPIGVFDSGIGGTSIWNEINQLLPSENSIYLADSKHAPYGIRSKEEIIRLSDKNTSLLLNKGCKIIVIACNTATTNAISYLRKKYDVPFIGIEPAIKPASLKTESKIIGILATKGTLSSSLFQETTNLYKQGIEIIEQEGTGIVELIENGKLDSEEMTLLLRSYVLPMVERGIDHLVLGCSHYPYLIPNLRKILPESITIIDSGYAVAIQTKAVLTQFNLLNKNSDAGQHQFYTNGTAEVLNLILGNRFTVLAKDF
ncbi:glutamate racemase [Vicingaceae bacterium]|nr:glutamate racemase [Vicingaceae bacterium]